MVLGGYNLVLGHLVGFGWLWLILDGFGWFLVLVCSKVLILSLTII